MMVVGRVSGVSRDGEGDRGMGVSDSSASLGMTIWALGMANWALGMTIWGEGVLVRDDGWVDAAPCPWVPAWGAE